MTCFSSFKCLIKENLSINLSIRSIFFFLASHSIPFFSQTSNSLHFTRLLPSSKGNSFRVIHCITQDKQGLIWIASPYGLARYDGNEYILFEHKVGDPSSLIDNYLFSVIEDSHGNLWITSDKGLELFNRETGQFIHYQHDSDIPDSIPSPTVYSIAEDKTGNIWLGTEVGLCRVDYFEQQLLQYPYKNQLPDNPVYGLLFDEKDNLWMSTNKGLFRLNYQTLNHSIYGPEDGLQGKKFKPGVCFKSND